jgi:hypothetical protein
MSTFIIEQQEIYLNELVPGEWQYSTDNQNFINIYPTYSVPIEIKNPDPTTLSTNVYITSNLTIISQFQYIIIGTNKINIYGNQNTIKTVNTTSGPLLGFIQNGSATENGKDDILIQELKFSNIGNVIFQDNTGHLIQSYFGIGTNNNKLQSLINESDINMNNGGGIGGINIGLNSNNFNVINCQNYGNINASGSAGLFSNNFLSEKNDPSLNSTSAFCIALKNYGNIIGIGASGLFSISSFRYINNLFIEIINNYGNSNISNYNIFGNSSFDAAKNIRFYRIFNYGKTYNGIFGNSNFNNIEGNIDIYYCGNFGEIGDGNSLQNSGIFGELNFFQGKFGSNITVTQCFNIGTIGSNFSSGIFGSNNFNNSQSNIIVKQCYNSGNIGVDSIETQYNSGIFGQQNFQNCFNNTIVIADLYNDGILKSNYSSGIFGKNCFLNSNSDFIIKNIYNNFDLNDLSNSGILGEFTDPSLTNNITINLSFIYSIYGNSLFSSNAIYNTNQILPAGITINLNSENVQSSVNWSNSIASVCLFNVANYSNNYLEYNLGASSFIDTNIITSSSPVILDIPYKLIFVDNSIYNNSETYIAGSPINPNISQTFGTFEIINSSVVAVQNETFGTINSPSGIINTNGNLATEQNINTLVYKIGAYEYQSTVYEKTYLFTTFSSNINGVCLLGFNKILCENLVYTKIQDLKVGDKVQTECGFIAIKYVYKSKIYHKKNMNRVKDQLYILQKKDYPELIEDIILTGGHPILVDEYPIEVELKHQKVWPNSNNRKLKNKFRFLTFLNDKANVYEYEGLYDIYNVVLENNDKNQNYMIYVNGIQTESLAESIYEKFTNKKN